MKESLEKMAKLCKYLGLSAYVDDHESAFNAKGHNFLFDPKTLRVRLITYKISGHNGDSFDEQEEEVTDSVINNFLHGLENRALVIYRQRKEKASNRQEILKEIYDET